MTGPIISDSTDPSNEPNSLSPKRSSSTSDRLTTQFISHQFKEIQAAIDNLNHSLNELRRNLFKRKTDEAQIRLAFQSLRKAATRVENELWSACDTIDAAAATLEIKIDETIVFGRAASLEHKLLAAEAAKSKGELVLLAREVFELAKQRSAK